MQRSMNKEEMKEMAQEGKSEIHITNNFNAPIGQHIDHVDTINFRMDGDGTFHFGKVEEIHVAKEVPACLKTEEANDLWEIAKEEDWVDEDLQPKGLSRPDAALLAARMAKVLGIEGWVPFEQLWHRQNMRQDYNKSQYNQKTDEFEKELKRKLK